MIPTINDTNHPPPRVGIILGYWVCSLFLPPQDIYFTVRDGGAYESAANCHKIENYFQFIHKIKNNNSVRFDRTAFMFEIKVVRNFILININLHDQPFRV